jgi:hypothetical protein
VGRGVKGGVAAPSRTAKRAALASTRAARRPLTRGARERDTREAESMLPLHRPPCAAVNQSLLGSALRAGTDPAGMGSGKRRAVIGG